MTSLSAALHHHFRAAVRSRGAAYARGGRVQIERSSTTRIAARVRGTMTYDVELARGDGHVQAACTCPSFDSEMCKHIWAVILAADARNLLQGVGRNGKLALQDGTFEWDRGAADAGEGAGGGDAAIDDADDEWTDGDDELDAGFDGGLDNAFAKRPSGASGAAPSAALTARTVRATASRGARGTGGTPAERADWRTQLGRLRAPEQPRPYEFWPAGRELLYVIDAAASRSGRGVQLEVLQRDRKKDGTPTKPKARAIPFVLSSRSLDASDRRVLAFLAGATQLYGAYGYNDVANYDYRALPPRLRLTDPQPELLVPMLCATGRCRLRLAPDDDPDAWPVLAWDSGEPWQFRIEVARAADGRCYEIRGALERGTERLGLDEPVVMTAGGIMFTRERAGRFADVRAFGWIALLREQRVLTVPLDQGPELVAELMSLPALPALSLPAELRYEQVEATPRPRLLVRRSTDDWRWSGYLRGELAFDYAGTIVAADRPTRGVVQAAERRILLRSEAAEREAAALLEQLGWRRREPGYGEAAATSALELPASRLPKAVRELAQAGWHVEAEGKLYRTAGRFGFHVASGVDWFELHGTVDFGDGVGADLPQLLAAARRGETTVRLGDGSLGLLPEKWLERYGLLAGLGRVHGDHLRFTRGQAGLLDALLAAEPDGSFDAVFEKARAELAGFAGVRAAAAPRGFRGKLRRYQKEGLGWFGFLRDFGFGGCLADDMGLGKTVQVLALLESRRQARVGMPSLVVVPKSLVFNWLEEAARFAPRLRVSDHTGPQRGRVRARVGRSDVVLTTYGTLRNDAAELKDVRFDYVILDEAQAIKNASSASAKAARLLKAEHRLALSGTPIENHLGELWSLFEFLNPGMLGTATVFKSLSAGADAPDSDARRLLAHATRPFLLRRTKAQVLRELPPKVEQTLYCELEKKQRKLYDELRDHYRASLLRRVERDGIKRAKIQVLEALLRLRQAALHPGLIDTRRTSEPSAKLDMLLPQLAEVLDEGHKTLVFSQFTSMLAIVRGRLDAAGMRYEYLDGSTRDREACVRRFQADPDCRLFLISLKAGGLGLNLTAAQYVFLLDPWWNPAVEAQAIDRAHRIGQRERVFAYRLIARDTIEEKVLALQTAKRELADAIVGADNALIRSLTREDLELLLS